MYISILAMIFYVCQFMLTLYALGKDKKGSCNLPRVDSTTCLFPVEEKAVEYYFASDAR
jgi:hypothetical protein